MVITPGSRVGKYEVKRLLGQGGFGMVYVGHDVGLDRDCALKFLLPEHTTRPEILQRFLKEARSAAKIKHGGIVTVFECGVVEGAGALDGMAYIAMELLEGQSLHERLQAGAMAVDAAVEIARQVASALGAAHAAGIVHRDLKPDNIFLVPDPATALGERVKVLDFGIAKLADDTGGSTHKTSTHMIFGTPKYMSPEQCKSTAKVDERSDIYALGCILFELVCGRAPFEGDAGELIGKHQYKDPPPPRSLRPDLSESLEAAIAAMLAKEPGDRPATMAEVSRLLGARTAAMAAASRPIEVPPTLAPDAPSTPPPTPPAIAPASSPPPGIAQVASTEPIADRRPAESVAEVKAVVPIVETAAPRKRKLWPLAVAAGVVVVGGAIAIAVAPDADRTVVGDGGVVVTRDGAPAELAGAALIDRLVEYLGKAKPLVAESSCDAVAKLRDEARAVSPVIARELERLRCGEPRLEYHAPDPLKTYAVGIDGAPADGPAGAKVTMVHISEYACPYCEKVRPTLAQLRQKYGDDLRIVHQQLVVHPDTAMASALAICAAARQGKHDAMDRLLWEKGFLARKLDPSVVVDNGQQRKCWDTAGGCPLVVGFAREAGLDVTKLKVDMRGPCVDAIAVEAKRLQTFAVTGIPAFFINGRFLSGAMPVESFAAVIDEELKKANAAIAAGTPAAQYYQRHVLERGLTAVPKPPAIDLDAPEPLGSKDILARPLEPGPVFAQQIALGWDFSSKDQRSATRPKADADVLAQALLEAVRAQQDLAAIAKLTIALSELRTSPLYDLATAQTADDPDEKLSWHAFGRRLRVGETGLVKSQAGWHVVRRFEPPPPPFDAAAAPATATVIDNGISYRVLVAGSGKKPVAGDAVKLHMEAWTAAGKPIESTTVVRGEPQVVRLNQPGWTDVVTQIGAGGKARMWVPEKLITKSALLPTPTSVVYDVEIVEILRAPPAPPDVTAPPPNAQRTAGGVAYRVLSSGSGGPKPTRDSKVRVNYAGWTTDGKSFDATVFHGKPSEFALTGVIPGWTDGLQVMAVGDKVRFWIPEELAYKGAPGRPAGMLVFDIELLAILPPKPAP